jgi:peroxiredoxin
LPRIRELGATLVAVSPQLPDYSLSTAEKNALQFEVLSDVGNAVARRFGLVYRLDA